MACLCLSFSSFVTAAADIASSSSIFSVMPAALDAIILPAPLKMSLTGQMLLVVI